MLLPNLVEEKRGACVKIHPFKWYVHLSITRGVGDTENEGLIELGEEGSIDLFCNILSSFSITHALLTFTYIRK